MGRLQKRLAIAGFFLALTSAVTASPSEGTGGLAPRVSRALEDGSTSALADLFPADRKVAVSLDRIADLSGFIGPGPLVEALHRYLGERTDVRFDALAASEGARKGSERVKGTLVSRDRSGRRERVGLVFVFEHIDNAWRAVEVRETG